MLKSSATDPILKGVLNLSILGDTLAINLGDALWSTGRSAAQASDIISGKQDLIAYLTAENITKDSNGNITGFTSSEKLFTGMKFLWDGRFNLALPANDNLIDQIINHAMVA